MESNSDISLSLEDFERWKVDGLKKFLRDRGLKVHNKKKAELTALAYAAHQMNVAVKPTADENDSLKAASYQRLLYVDNDNKLPDPVTDLEDGWVGEEHGIKLWPPILQCDITEYLLTRDDRDIGKRMLSDYKEGKAYSYFDSRWLKEVFFHEVSTQSQWCFLKSECTPSDSINNPNHKLWVIVTKKNGEVKSAYCTCFAGLGSTCNHVAALLFKVEDAWKKGLQNESCTSRPCEWNQYGAGKTEIRATRVTDMKWRKPHYTKKDKETTINPLRRQLFSPTEYSNSMSENPNTLGKILNAMYPSCTKACVFDYVQVPLPKAEHTSADFNVDNFQEVETTEQVPAPLTSLPVNDVDPTVFFNSIPVMNDGQVHALEQDTTKQAECDRWKTQRVGRITGSIAHRVKTKVSTLLNINCNRSKDTSALVSTILGKNVVDPNLPNLKYGRQMEGEAIKAYIVHQQRLGHKNVQVQKCGLVVLSEKPYIGASPDGRITCDCCGSGVLEVKCPISIAHQDPNEHGMSYLENHQGRWQLKQNHSYFTQVQAELAVTKLKWCDFVVFSTKGLIVERIMFNANIWLEIENAAQYFFQLHVCPRLLADIIVANHIIGLGNGPLTAKPLNVIPTDQSSTIKYHIIGIENRPLTATPLNAVPKDQSSNIEFSQNTTQNVNFVSPIFQKALPSTSTKRKRKVKTKKEARPKYSCQVCDLECKYPDEIEQNSDNSVECDICQQWYHWGCAGYEGDGEWYCESCENQQFGAINF